jgi:hypothetical protein
MSVQETTEWFETASYIIISAFGGAVTFGGIQGLIGLVEKKKSSETVWDSGDASNARIKNVFKAAGLGLVVGGLAGPVILPPIMKRVDNWMDSAKVVTAKENNSVAMTPVENKNAVHQAGLDVAARESKGFYAPELWALNA